MIAALLLVNGCETPELVPESPGRGIKFKAATTWDNSKMKTKTVYSGVVIGETNPKERIDWVAGDKIRIYSDKATYSLDASVHYADYSVNNDVSSSGASSYASITPAGDLSGTAAHADSPNGLVWGTGTHKFFSVYPSPAVTGGNLSFFESGTDYCSFMATIPKEVVFKASDVVDGVLKPDMNFAYMYAMAQAEANSTVELKYKPMFTAFQFTLDSGDDDQLTFYNFYLASALDNPYDDSEAPAGDYNAILTMPADPQQANIVYNLPGMTAEYNQIHVQFGEHGEGITITKGHPLTFTIFARPIDYTQLKITVETSKTGTTDGRRTKTDELKIVGEGGTEEWATFPACHKFNFKFGIPGEWIYVIDDPIDVTLTYEGGEKSLRLDNKFHSYRTRYGQIEPVAYKLQYSTDDGTSWTDGLPTWLGATSPSSFKGSIEGEDLILTMASQDNTAADPHGDILKDKGEASGIIDLSTINVATGATVATTTANCYVVQQAGTYKFPVVYGNGVTDGAVNPSAYTGTPIPNGSEHDKDKPYFLEAFRDDENNDITDSPYIEIHKGGISVEPVLIWMDEENLVTNIGKEGSGADAYITFKVPVENIRQGNALIAATDGSGNIVWSWHIWVTDHDLTQSVKSPTGYSIAPYNLGWCDGRELEKYLERNCRIRAVQIDEGQALTGTDNISEKADVLQEAHKTIVRDNNPYYQWGRKDPQRASNGLEDGAGGFQYKTIINNELYEVAVVDIKNHICPSTSTTTTVGTSIREPHLYYYGKYNDYMFDWNREHSFDNLWNSRLTTRKVYGSAGVFVTKTIYDPSPVGFKVGPATAYNYFPRVQMTSVTNTELTVGGNNFAPGSVFLPLVGVRSSGDDATGEPRALDRAGWYSTASVSEDENNMQSLNTYVGKCFMSQTDRRTYGLSLRPVVDDDFSKGLSAPGENVIWD